MDARESSARTYCLSASVEKRVVEGPTLRWRQKRRILRVRPEPAWLLGSLPDSPRDWSSDLLQTQDIRPAAQVGSVFAYESQHDAVQAERETRAVSGSPVGTCESEGATEVIFVIVR